MKSDFEVSKELYEALKSMTESYDFAMQLTPPGPTRDSFADFFISTKPQADSALRSFEVLKARPKSIHSPIASDYMINLLSSVPQHLR